MLEQCGVEFEARSDETDASDATRIISCTGVRVISFIWSSDWTMSESERSHHCTIVSLMQLV